GPLAFGMILLGLASIPGFRRLFSKADYAATTEAARQIESPQKWINVLATLILASVGIIVLVNCFVPPGAHEWDALSYHLAAPKVFIQHHRIVYLPTDHHSNFPFTMQMLFLIGLLFNGYGLANLIHFATGALAVGMLFVLARKRLS